MLTSDCVFNGWASEQKDKLETVLARLVCAGEVPLDVARQAIARDWHEAYRRYVRAGFP